MVEIIFFSALWKRQTERQCKEWNVWSGRQPNYPNLARATEKNCTFYYFFPWWIRQIPLYTFDFVKPVCRLKWFIFWVETVLMSPAIYVYLSISYAPKYINYRDLCYRNGLSACEMGKFVAERARTHTHKKTELIGAGFGFELDRVYDARAHSARALRNFLALSNN